MTMSQAYKVTQAFQATVSKEDKTPKTVELNGNTFNVWKVKLDGHGDKGWINVNKKPGNEIKQGDELYGEIAKIDGKFGTFYNFKSASKPFGETVQPTQPEGTYRTDDIHQKLDYVIELLESLVENGTPSRETKSVGSTPVNLDELDI